MAMNNQTAVQMCPPSLKSLQPFLVRARDFDAKDPQIAYLCKSYAAELGVKTLDTLSGEAKDVATQFLMTLMDHLEEEKEDEAKSKTGGKEALLRCALLMFKRADDKERSGGADRMCVSMFLTSACLMEVTKQFGEMDPDVHEKQLYAKVTAARIKKALDSGIPYESPNAPLDEPADSAPPPPVDEPAAPPAVDTSFAGYATGLGADTQPPAYVDPTPPPPPPPADVNFSDMDGLLAQLAAQNSEGSNHVDSDPLADPAVDQIEARLQNLMHGTPPTESFTNGAPPAMPQAQPDPSVMLRVSELEAENTRLRHELASAQTKAEQNAREMQKYQQAVQLLQQQLASSRSGGGNPSILTPRPGFDPTINDMSDAQKFSKFVTSALQFKDVANARENLLKAMAKLNGHPH